MCADGLRIASTEEQPVMPDASQAGRDTGCRVEVVTKPAGLEALRESWASLARRAAPANPFIHPDWIISWWQAFGANRRLYVLAAWRGPELVGVLPLALTDRWRYGIRVRVLGATVNDHSPRFDLLVAPETSGVVADLWNSLIADVPDWDLLELSPMPARSRNLIRFMRLARAEGMRHGLWEAAGSPRIHTRLPWEAYLAQRSSNFRKQLRRKLRRLSARGPLALEIIDRPEDLARALPEALAIEAAGWKGQRGSAIDSRPEVRCFYTRLASALSAKGELRLHFLTLAGRRIAFDLSIFSSQRLYSLKAGYLNDEAADSPGTLLVYHMLMHYMASGLVEFDLLGEPDAFKRQWTRDVRRHQWLVCFSGSVRSLAVYALKFRLAPAIRQFARN